MTPRRVTSPFKIAEECLTKFGCGIPVDVDGIARAHGIEILAEDLEDEISGMLIIRGQKATIGVNRWHHPHRQRFTVAHELGHYLLHRDALHLFVDASPVFYRRSGSAPADKIQERQANEFAAALLMPDPTIKVALANQPLDIF